MRRLSSEKMLLPTREYCERLFERYKVPAHIKRHCVKVNQVAIFLAKKLKEPVDIELVDRLSLLHDLMKATALKELKKDERFGAPEPTKEELAMWKSLKEKYHGMHETEIAHEILKDKYPEFAKAMLEEGKRDVPIKSKRIEAQIVQYADWRVFQETIISLKERIADLSNRYKAVHEKEGLNKWKAMQRDILEFEKELFKKLDFKPEDLSLE